MEYQHKVIRVDASEVEAKLNELGLKGWRLVQVVDAGAYEVQVYMVRENP